MAAITNPSGISYRQAAPRGSGRYEVLYRGRPVDTVGRLGLGAGQFGSRWVATAPDGRRSGSLLTRDAAAAWLVAQAGAG